MGKISEFSIKFNAPQQVFYPNQSIVGYVTLNLNEPMEMRGIRLKLTGKGYCHWTEQHTTHHGSGKNRRSRTKTVHYTGKERIINQIISLYGALPAAGSSKFTHAAGQYTYPFSFVLPSQLPTSFESHTGHIRYYLKGTIDKPWKFDRTVKCPMTINDLIDTNNPMYAQGGGGEKVKEVGCLCCAAGNVEYSANVDRGCYCPGEAILINANVANKTTRDMTSLYAKLYQTAHYHASNKTKTVTREIAKINGPPILKGEFATWENQPFGIPAIPPTITNSRVITVQYSLHIKIGVPMGIDPSIDINVVMGTIPHRGTYGRPVDYGAAQIQQAAPEANFNFGAGPSTAYPPPEPSVFGYPDMPPPSYSAAVGETGVNIGGDKDGHTFGNMSYQPVYTFAQPYQGAVVQPYQGAAAQPYQGAAAQPYQGAAAQPYQGGAAQSNQGVDAQPPPYNAIDPALEKPPIP